MLNLPSQKKWQIYCSRKGGEDTVDQSHAPEHYIERLRTLASVSVLKHYHCNLFHCNALTFINRLMILQMEYPETNVDEEVRSRTKQIDGLKTALRTSTNSFVLRFIELEGLPALLTFLERMDYFTAQSTIHTSIIGCVKALMNNSVSL